MDEDEKIFMLLSMGFVDVNAIKQALKVSNGDMNEAVTCLTEQPISSYSTVGDLRDVDMADAAGVGALPSYDQSSSSTGLEFPAPSLYELESRVFTESWSIPYKRDEALGKCLLAATKLAEEGLSQADESCAIFLDKCLPECFQKLLASGAVRRWSPEIQEGVFVMLDLLMDLVIAHLKNGIIHNNILKNFALAFDCECEWNQKNKHRSPDYVAKNTFADINSSFDSYGWLIDIINIFADRDGFNLLAKLFNEKKDLDAENISSLLMPIGKSAKFLVKDLAFPLFKRGFERTFDFVFNLEEKQLKSQKTFYFYELLESLHFSCVSLWPEEVERTNKMRLDMIIKMLKTPHFSSRMNALKELARLIEDGSKRKSDHLDCDYIQEWMIEKKVLSLALDGNIDQVQYTDRMKEVVEFIAPKLTEEELSRIWQMSHKASPHVVDNIHRIMAVAATRFNPHQFTHLLKLVRNSWENSKERLREKLLSFIGKIGQDSRLGRTAETLLDTLWELSRVADLAPHLVHQAINEHLSILNESVNREGIRKTYIIRCVDDIRRSPAVYLPLKQLYYLCQSITTNKTSYMPKSGKATLSELASSHDIIKLVTSSMSKCHGIAVKSCGGKQPSPDTMIDSKYTHEEYVRAHLDFLLYLLKEGDIYLPWDQCKEMWDTLVNNANASHFDRETCFMWFSSCLNDLDNQTQKELFSERLLKLNPITLTPPAFTCFVDFFHAVNLNENRLLKNVNIIVDRLELIGLDFIWLIVLECLDESLAEDAMKLLLEMSFVLLSPKLKRDPPQIHQRFISECYKKLERSYLRYSETAVGSAVSTATKTLTAMAVSDISSHTSASKNSCLQHIRRVLILAEYYINTAEEHYDGQRSFPPHAATFIGKPIVLHVTADGNKLDLLLHCHSNEQIGAIRNKISACAGIYSDQIQQLSFLLEDYSGLMNNNNDGNGNNVCTINGSDHDNRLLHQLDVHSNCSVNVKINNNNSAQLKEIDNWNALPGATSHSDTTEENDQLNYVFGPLPQSAAAGTSKAVGASPPKSTPSTSGAAGGGGGGDFNLEREKQLPGVVMACQGHEVFGILYRLALLDDQRINNAVRSVLYLIPTDHNVFDKFDSICTGGSCRSIDTPKNSPASSPLKKEKKKDKEKKTGNEVLKSLLDLNSPGITPFKLLYNLEVLSGKIMPLASEPNMQGNSKFCEQFLIAGGLTLITSLLQKDSLPQDVDYEIRQSIYLIVLQLLRCLLCGPGNGLETPVICNQQFPNPPKRSALDASVEGNWNNSSPLIASKVIHDLNADDWIEMVSNLMRVIWAGAAGKLTLSSSIESPSSPPDITKSSRQNSTGSSGSDNEKVLQSGICVQQSIIPSTDALIASESLHIFTTLLSLRPNLLDKWYQIPNVKDFLIDVLVGCSSQDVREKACSQLMELSYLHTSVHLHPRYFLIQVLLKAPLPFWVSSANARGPTLRFASQSTQYFMLISKLLSGLNANEQKQLEINCLQMLEEEKNWLHNFTATPEAARERAESGVSSLRFADNVLVAGHLNIINALTTCEGVNKEEFGLSIVALIIYDYLFPASKLIVQANSDECFQEKNQNNQPKCTGIESRLAAYRLLCQLTTGYSKTLSLVVELLISVHHELNCDSLKELEHVPFVDGRCSSGYVGLKNGGATCYMNSVLQQLFLVPGIREDILAINTVDENEESLFYQLQTVFGHLLESQLQYYIPEKFWKCFRMDGHPVNVREQQDAFEFYVRLIEQIDDFLKSKKLPTVFAQRFEGVYSFQRLCQDCPHQFEREEPFLALNLTVTKCHDLQDSLEQFVKGELLEGDNAYFCEKCSQKRTALIRTCIKTLPPVLVIQLKRFGYDWEASRALKFDDYFKFPWTLDMGAYTAEGLTDREDAFTRANDSDNSCSTPHKSTPLKDLKPAFTSPKVNLPLKHKSALYELVGVVVHSGQASAGHYYSYIKDRRGDPLTNPKKNKWFRYNDTTVEEVEMTDSMLEQECFGGTYKAKVSFNSSSPLPEERLRYWNGYLLFYDSIEDRSCTPRTPKTPRLGLTTRSLRVSASSAKKKLSLGGSPTAPINSRAARSSLSELTELLQQGEKQGMFRQHMPPRILSTITHNNLIFSKDRDLYSHHYYNLIYQICSTNYEFYMNSSGMKPDLVIDSTKLAFNFLLNTYLRIKDKDETIVNQWTDLIHSMCQLSHEASSWSIKFFSCDKGSYHLNSFLLESNDKMVRTNFGTILSNLLEEECKHQKNVTTVEEIIKHLLSMLTSEVPTAVKTSLQYFTVLQKYCMQGSAQCEQMIQLNGFSYLVHFLLGNADDNKRQWSSVQTQNFGPLHVTIAIIVKHSLNQIESSTSFDKDMTEDDRCKNIEEIKSRMSSDVCELVYGKYQMKWLREAVSTYKEILGFLPILNEALLMAATDNSTFSIAVLTTLLIQYASTPSNMLKELSQLLLDILCISDSIQNERIKSVMEGFNGSNSESITPLFHLIEANKEHDSRRAYQCIKLIVTLSSKSQIARDFLTNTSSRWQWSVEWLKERMDDHGSNFNNSSELSSNSNEDSNTKNFQRTTSALLTLEEATALLGEMEPAEMEVDYDEPVPLGDIRESPSEAESSPAQDINIE